MKITNNAALTNYNSFHVSVKAKYLIEIEHSDEVQTLCKTDYVINNKVYILGGGSNILFTKDFDGLILHSKIEDIEIVSETESYVDIKCGSGVNWDWFVNYCVNHDWGGIENLSDIPGNVGAAPVQNIGAYGVEVKDVIIQVEGVDYSTGIPFRLTNQECVFDYRNSFFKTEPTFFITYVVFRLSKKHTLITHYGAVEEVIKTYDKRTIQNLRQAIVSIRRSKLPSIDELGSGGSFFKNPIVGKTVANDLRVRFPEMPKYKHGINTYKLSAAWLIDQAGLKGKNIGNVGTYPLQPLVIVNYGNASGKEIANFAEYIKEEVFKKFGILLEPEVIFK
jgi:UDP-N-acetylmuramate dehydrogenase